MKKRGISEIISRVNLFIDFAFEMDLDKIQEFLKECETAEAIGPLMNPSEFNEMYEDASWETYQKNKKAIEATAEYLEKLREIKNG